MKLRDRRVDRFSQPSVKERYAEGRHQFFHWWRFWPHDMPIHKIGRTVPGLQPMFDDDAVEDLVETLGYQPIRGWTSLSLVQQVDFIATWLLQQDRTAHGRSYQGHLEYKVLTQDQYAHRVQHEYPMPHGAMDALLVHYPTRVQRYTGGVSWGTGNHTEYPGPLPVLGMPTQERRSDSMCKASGCVKMATAVLDIHVMGMVVSLCGVHDGRYHRGIEVEVFGGRRTRGVLITKESHG